MNPGYILAYPRTGSTLVRYLLECLSGRTCAQPSGDGARRPLSDIIAERTHLDTPTVDALLEPISVKAHFPEEIGFWDKSRPLLMLLRDPREVIPSYMHGRRRSTDTVSEFCANLATDPELMLEAGRFCGNIRFWDDWHGPKDIIDYRDLMIHLPRIAQTLIGLFDLPDPPANAYTELATWAEQCMAYKNTPGSHPITTRGRLEVFSQWLPVGALRMLSEATGLYGSHV